MAALPPYSTYRTDAKQMLYPQATSHGNVLSFTPPGFKQELHVKFPDSRLAVCQKCKKNFKTKDMCRVRNQHTSPPWTTAFICVTIDDSCLDAGGKFVNAPMTVRMVQWQPFCVKKPFDPKTPVCAACKRTNRTKNFCRERHQHCQLPWCTVYVLLSTLESVDPSTVVAGPSFKSENEPSFKSESDEQPPSSGGDGADSPTSEASVSKVKGDDTTVCSETASTATGEDINDIPESRTFLAKVDSQGSSIHWLELSDYDTSQAAPFPGVPPPVPTPAPFIFPPAMLSMDPMQASYYPSNMAFAAQQQQSALKTRQQYFFQMHQQQMPTTAAAAQWQQQQQPVAAPNFLTLPGQGEPPNITTAGEAAAAARQQGEDSQPQYQHWTVYYPPPSGPNGGGGASSGGGGDDAFQEPDSKRPRIL